MQPARRSFRLSDRLSALWRDRTMMLKAVSFAVVGMINFIVDFSVFSFAF